MTAPRAYAEFIGTFALMFVGGGAAIMSNGENLAAIALANGLILAVMATALIHISGGQFNPAVSPVRGSVLRAAAACVWQCA